MKVDCFFVANQEFKNERISNYDLLLRICVMKENVRTTSPHKIRNWTCNQTRKLIDRIFNFKDNVIGIILVIKIIKGRNIHLAAVMVVW